MKNLMHSLLTFVSLFAVCASLALVLKLTEKPELYTPKLPRPDYVFGPTVFDVVVALGENPEDVFELYAGEASEPIIYDPRQPKGTRWIRTR